MVGVGVFVTSAAAGAGVCHIVLSPGEISVATIEIGEVMSDPIFVGGREVCHYLFYVVPVDKIEEITVDFVSAVEEGTGCVVSP